METIAKDWWQEARLRLSETTCRVCQAPTLYIDDPASDDLQPPETCGRLKCLVEVDPEHWGC